MTPSQTSTQDVLTAQSTMREVLEAYPGAQRALFRRYHIGGCSSCAFQPDETVQQLCDRNGALNPEEVLSHLQTSHEQDAQLLISPRELAEWRSRDPALRVVDVRSREEFEAVHIDGSVLLSQPVMREIMAEAPTPGRSSLSIIREKRAWTPRRISSGTACKTSAVCVEASMPGRRR
jgi:hypothetical protein